MKRIIICIVLGLSLVSCKTDTVDNNDGRNPLMNDDSFTNFVPWWVTNTVSSTNGVIK